MKYCHICGTPIEDDSIITCPSCGRKQHSFRRPDGVVIDPYQMAAKKSAPEPEVIAPVPEPIIEEPIIEEPIIEEPPVVEKTPIPQEKAALEPEVAPSPAIPQTKEEKPAKKKKGLLIGVIAAVVGLIAIGTAGAFFIPRIINGGSGDNTSGGGIFHSRPTGNANPVAMDPIGAWSSGSLHYEFLEDGAAKYWQTNSNNGNLDWLYYGTWNRTGSNVKAEYTLYFNSGCMYTTMEQNFIVYSDHIENASGAKYEEDRKATPVVDAICNVYSDAQEYNQSAGKTGHWLELGLNNTCIFRQYENGGRLDFFKGTWSKINATTLKITMNQKMVGGSGSYTSITPSSDTLTIGNGYLIWGEDTMYPLTAKES